MAKIQKLARQALKTFRNPHGLPVKENLELLKSMVRSIRRITYFLPGDKFVIVK